MAAAAARRLRRNSLASCHVSGTQTGMCRIAGYLGRPIALEDVLTKPPHALRAQGLAPRELPPGMIGSDGYGVAWFAEGVREPARYRQTLPIWVDDNLDTLAPHVRSSCIVASTRTATPDMPVAITNTPPFLAGRIALAHNGSIARFHERVVESLRAALSPGARAALRGNSDTEYLAALLGEQPHETLAARVRAMLAFVGERVAEARTEAALNVIASDGDELVAVRHARGADAPTLYMAVRAPGDVLVASEPMNDDDEWTRLAEGTLLAARRGQPPRIERLFES